MCAPIEIWAWVWVPTMTNYANSGRWVYALIGVLR